MNISRFFGIVLSIVLACFLANCTSGSGHGAPPYTTPLDTQTGRLLDGAVTGVEYSTPHWSHLTGFDGIKPTDVKGGFLYQPGEEVTFSIGGVVLGSTKAKRTVTPIDLVPDAEDQNNDTVIHMCQFLQTLDDDLVPENGIFITEEVRDALAGFEPVEFNTLSVEDVEGIFVTLNAENVFPEERSLVSAEAALSHFEDTLIVIEEEESRLEPFSAGISKPVWDVISFQGQSFPISGWATGGTGSYIIEWILRNGNNELYRGPEPPANISGLAAGRYVLEYEATDYAYGKTIRDRRIINIYDSSINPFPSYSVPLTLLSFGNENVNIAQGENIALRAQITQGNPPFFYFWSYPSSAAYSLPDTNDPLNAVFTFSTPGTYQVRIIIRDTMAFGDTSYDENNCDYTITVR